MGSVIHEFEVSKAESKVSSDEETVKGSNHSTRAGNVQRPQQNFNGVFRVLHLGNQGLANTDCVEQ